MKTIVLMILAFMATTLAHAQTPAFDPRDWKGTQAGPPTQILVLGTAHLSQLPDTFQPAMLGLLIDKLAAYKPEIITHEGISGEQCDTLKRYATTYPGMFDTYCWSTTEAEKATGLSVASAMAEIEKILAAWPKVPTAAQRRQLAALFLAAGDRPSAGVQWQRLAVAERRSGDGIDEPLLKTLQRAGAKSNETFDIVVPLAARLGLERVYAIDDHTADSIQALAGPGFEPAIQKIWNSGDFPVSKDYDRQAKALRTSTDMINFYRFINNPDTQRGFINADFGAALKQQTPELYGRQYVAWYETRNLRMIANIRTAFGNHPGARVLSIVGASHKPYFDAYLNMMHEVKLMDAEGVLR